MIDRIREAGKQKGKEYPIYTHRDGRVLSSRKALEKLGVHDPEPDGRSLRKGVPKSKAKSQAKAKAKAKAKARGTTTDEEASSHGEDPESQPENSDVD